VMTRAGFMIMTPRQSRNPPNGKIQTHCDRKRWGRWRAKSAACLSFSLSSRRLLTKQSKQSVLHTTVVCYSDCTKMCKDFALNFNSKRTGCCIMTVHCLTLPFSPKTVWLSFRIHPVFLFP
jgi:hypothetical protein